MIRIDNQELYQRSLRSLSAYVPRGYWGRLVQIFLAAKYYGAAMPRVGGGEGIDVSEFQHALDRFYRKSSLRDWDGSVAMVFQNNHLVPTGQLGRGLETPSNIWRNNLGLQKAMICYASERELMDDRFLRQPRVQCRHLRPEVAGSLRGARCGLQLAASYRNEDGPKGLRRDPIDGGFAIVDPDRLDHWRDIVAPQGRRLPVLPLIAALYYDSELASGRREIDTVDFRRDFGFTAAEFRAFFECDAQAGPNRALARDLPRLRLSWTEPAEAERVEPAHLPQVQPGRRRPGPRGRREPLDPDNLPELAPRTAPPAGNHWWSAEQAVETYLRDSGWDVINRTRQLVGFDLEIRRPREQRHYYVEVKSSVGPCAPILTRNEYEAARRHGRRYILAIVENFDPMRDVSILWVPNPASLPLSSRTVEQYPVPRSIWLRSAEALIP